MPSLSNIEEHLQEQPLKNRGVDNLEEKPGKAKPNENLPKTMEADKNKEFEISTTMADLPSSAGRHRKLPPELNCQIFYCLNVATRRKFILRLGWNFYAFSRQSLLLKSMRLCNPRGNNWSRSNENVTIAEDGLVAHNNNNTNEWHLQNVYAEKGFPISVADCRMDNFLGTICYYFEIQSLSDRFWTGFFHGGFVISEFNRSRYSIATFETNGHLQDYQFFEMPVGARQEPNAAGNVFGCGILIDPDNKLTIFFTLNGILLGTQIPISPSVNLLFPAVLIIEDVLTLEANFGDDKDKPFQYDIRKCPRLELDCI